MAEYQPEDDTEPKDGALGSPLLPPTANPPLSSLTSRSSGNRSALNAPRSLHQRHKLLLCCMFGMGAAAVTATALLIFMSDEFPSPTPFPTSPPTPMPSLSFIPTYSPTPVPPIPNATTAFMVETLPLLNFSLQPIPGSLPTHEVLINLVRHASKRLKISVMYWNLLSAQTDDWPGDDDADIYGAERGAQLYNELEAAATRGVEITILQDNSTSTLGHLDQLLALKRNYPDAVNIFWWDAGQWYGGGIMHMKLWVVDDRHTYIGSANMDWLSLSQVKEIGVVVYNASRSVTRAADQLFAAWQSFSSQQPSTSSALDPTLGAHLLVPCWEPALSSSVRCSSPLPFPTFPNSWNDPAEWISDQRLPKGTTADFFISASPAAVLGNCGLASPWKGLRYSALYDCSRTWDIDGLVSTILDAEEFVYLSVMDFLPSNPSAYYVNTTCGGGVLWWPTLIDALLTAASASGVEVRVLVSWWTHSDASMLEYLADLVATASTSLALTSNPSNGSLSVGVFTVPGWNSTGSSASFPSYSRVNHAKYIVTDRRMNVGTSNMQWSYYYQTAGASLNTNVPYLRKQAAAVFDRDWSSSYTTPLQQFLVSGLAGLSAPKR